MTFAKNGTIMIPKNKAGFQMDLTLILKCGIEHGLITKEDIDCLYELATLSSEELHKKAKEELGSMISDLAGLFGEDAAGEILRELTGIHKED